MRGCSQLNRVSRTRSGVGRISTPAGNRRRRPRCRPAMMRRTRECAHVLARAPPACVMAARGCAAFSAVFHFLTNARGPCAAWLATFWGPSVPYGPNTTSSAHRSARRGNATGLILRKQNSEERTHEEAILQPLPWLSSFTAGCSSSVDNPPDVGRPIRRLATSLRRSTDHAVAQPRVVLAEPGRPALPARRLFHADRRALPTDGTLNLPSSAFFPATLRLPGTGVPSLWSMRSTDSPRRRRSSCASPRRSTSPPRPPASGSSKCTSIRPPRRRSAFPTTASPVRRVLVQDVDYRVETAPNIDAGGTLMQIVPLRPLLANNDAAGRHAPARHRLPGARHQRAARRERRRHRRGRRLRHDQDGRARESPAQLPSPMRA